MEEYADFVHCLEQTNDDGSDKPQEPAASEAAAAKDKGESV
ncbi:hypothetical protein PI126_g14380 [Phytophthora idaei]|nr:hypothetical protein PI126_g14380 [Phytophthora idaei]